MNRIPLLLGPIVFAIRHIIASIIVRLKKGPGPAEFLNRIDDLESVTVYNLQGLRDYTEEDLITATPAEIDLVRFREILRRAVHKKCAPVFKGTSLAIGRFGDGETVLLTLGLCRGPICVHGIIGAFFLAEEDCELWDEIYYQKIIEEVFIRAWEDEEDLEDKSTSWTYHHSRPTAKLSPK